MSNSVYAVLVYADLFDYPLTAKEILMRLSKKKTNIKKIKSDLSSLVKAEKINNKGSYFFLPGRRNLVEKRKRRQETSKAKIRKAKKYAGVLKLVPTVKLVGITGSVAAENACSDDDLDFLIISRSGWLWTTRFLSSLLFFALGLKRQPKTKRYQDKVCLNLFLEEGYLDIFQNQQNLFLAYEIMQMKPLWQRNNTYNRFLKANSWVKKYLPNLYPEKSKPKQLSKRKKGNFIEKVFYHLQLWWMRKRITKEQVEPHLIAFHPKDMSRKTMFVYQKKLKDLGCN